MRSRMLIITGLLASACGSAESPLAPAQSGVPALAVVGDRTVLVQDVSVAVPNFCTGEMLNLSGTLRISEKTQEGGTGWFHASFHTSLNLWGSGASSGDAYHLVEQNVLSSQLRKGDAGQTFTQQIRTRLLRKGAATDVSLVTKIHFTALANGERSVDFHEFSFDC